MLPRDRYAAVVNLLLLAGEQRTLIFVATRVATATLAEKLSGDGFSALPLSGDLPQAQRTRTLNAFRNGTVSILVATDVAARGLDVPEVSTVLHGDLPMDGEVYTHRSGRTGRAGRKGRSIILATSNNERRARRILADARVDAEWSLVPNAAHVNKTLRKRSRRAAREAVENAIGSASESELELAQSLLEDRDPAAVVAALLAVARSEKVREPFELERPVPRSVPRNAHPRDSRPQGGAFARFSINWGFRKGANPRRLLAVICRRGDVPSSVVGSIDIDEQTATFEIAERAASQFELRARRR